MYTRSFARRFANFAMSGRGRGSPGCGAPGAPQPFRATVGLASGRRVSSRGDPCAGSSAWRARTPATPAPASASRLCYHHLSPRPHASLPRPTGLHDRAWRRRCRAARWVVAPPSAFGADSGGFACWRGCRQVARRAGHAQLGGTEALMSFRLPTIIAPAGESREEVNAFLGLSLDAVARTMFNFALLPNQSVAKAFEVLPAELTHWEALNSRFDRRPGPIGIWRSAQR